MITVIVVRTQQHTDFIIVEKLVDWKSIRYRTLLIDKIKVALKVSTFVLDFKPISWIYSMSNKSKPRGRKLKSRSRVKLLIKQLLLSFEYFLKLPKLFLRTQSIRFKQQHNHKLLSVKFTFHNHWKYNSYTTVQSTYTQQYILCLCQKDNKSKLNQTLS